MSLSPVQANNFFSQEFSLSIERIQSPGQANTQEIASIMKEFHKENTANFNLINNNLNSLGSRIGEIEQFKAQASNAISENNIFARDKIDQLEKLEDLSSKKIFDQEQRIDIMNKEIGAINEKLKGSRPQGGQTGERKDG